MDPVAFNRFQTKLSDVIFNYPAIDNHAHALLHVDKRHDIPFEGLVSHLEGEALIKDAPYTLACYHATSELAKLYGLPRESTWEQVKAKRTEFEYDELCRRAFEPSGIQCILLDDGLGPDGALYDIPWHDQFTKSPTRRVIRIESVAEDILGSIFSNYSDRVTGFSTFYNSLRKYLTENTRDGHAVSFKTVVCYRTGLAVSPEPLAPDSEKLLSAFEKVREKYRSSSKIRLQEKVLNDFVVHIAMEIASVNDIPS
ncbi:hypothetical protein H0H93_016637 [Arthromyces matolae]|nr:hypothetical protein H0H93_016637 [Arthromyces matolae]